MWNKIKCLEFTEWQNVVLTTHKVLKIYRNLWEVKYQGYKKNESPLEKY